MKVQTLARQTAMFMAMVMATAGMAQEFQPLKRAPDQFQNFTETEFSEQLGVLLEIQRAYGGPYANLKVLSVKRGSIAERWGFERGDVLVSLDGKLTTSAAELDQAFQLAGRTMKVSYINVRNGRQESSFVEKPFQPRPPRPGDYDPVADALGMTVKKIWNDQMVVLDPGFGTARSMGLRTGDVIKGFAAVGIPVYPGQPSQPGAILSELRVFRFGQGEFTINVRDFGTVTFQP